MRRYTKKYKRDMDLADASLLWLAHESGLREVMTIDVKDWARYRLPGGEALSLLQQQPQKERLQSQLQIL